jgi:sec-independent protein translocase protein TatB
MHIGDSIFIFLLALVLFGPKKLPEIGRQIGKLLVEFRRASNDFKMQIDEELRAMELKDRMEQQEKKEAAAAAALATSSPLELGTPTILPPATGEPVSAANPYAVSAPEKSEPEEAAVAVSATSGEILSSEHHPLLTVDEIPPWEPPAHATAGANGHGERND